MRDWIRCTWKYIPRQHSIAISSTVIPLCRLCGITDAARRHQRRRGYSRPCLVVQLRWCNSSVSHRGLKIKAYTLSIQCIPIQRSVSLTFRQISIKLVTSIPVFWEQRALSVYLKLCQVGNGLGLGNLSNLHREQLMKADSAGLKATKLARVRVDKKKTRLTVKHSFRRVFLCLALNTSSSWWLTKHKYQRLLGRQWTSLVVDRTYRVGNHWIVVTNRCTVYTLINDGLPAIVTSYSHNGWALQYTVIELVVSIQLLTCYFISDSRAHIKGTIEIVAF